MNANILADGARLQTDDYRFYTHGLLDEGEAGNSASAKLISYKGIYVSITNICNTDVCSYCYARNEPRKDPMTPMEFVQILSWIEEISDVREVYLVGGEPTTSPHLSTILEECCVRGWKATIYTNGAFSVDVRRTLVDADALRRVAFHYEPFFFKRFKGLRERSLENIRILSSHRECSTNIVISYPEFDYSELLDIARVYGLLLTWIFAAPSAGRLPYIGLKSMLRTGHRLQEFLLKARSLGVRTAPDLPVPLCVFSQDFLESYGDEFSLKRRCKPFAYFRTDMSIQSCTSMACRSAPAPRNAQELREIILCNRAADEKMKKIPAFPECANCQHHLNRQCQGGCMTYRIYLNKDVEI